MGEDDEEFLPFEAWAKRIHDAMPWPDEGEVFQAIDGCGTDRAEERIVLLRSLVRAHFDASRVGVFNDE